jgi:hypothetical protein
LLRDFDAFYCAGNALAERADPYRAEPLGACERAPKAALFAPGRPGLAAPAPLPAYALAPFVVLSRLPFALAAALWTLLLLASVVIAIVAMQRATGAGWPGLVAAFALGDGYSSLALGQVAPVAVAAIALATLYAERRRDAAAAVAAAFATIEPHVGVPACLALFLWKPAARVPLALAGLICVVLSLVLAGPDVVREYIHAVVPAHALSELANEKQLSLAYLLHRLGAGDANALLAGSLSYAAMLALGVAGGGLLARRFAMPGLVVALPPALVLVGGPFVHIAQIPAALPAAILLGLRVPRARPLLAASSALLAVPWVQFSTLGTLFGLLAAFAVALVLYDLFDAPPLVAMLSGVATLAYVAVLLGLVVTPVANPDPLLVAHYDPRALAEASWTLYVQLVATSNLAAFDLARLPTIVGLLALLAAVVRFLAASGASFAPGGKGSESGARIALS